MPPTFTVYCSGDSTVEVDASDRRSLAHQSTGRPVEVSVTGQHVPRTSGPAGLPPLQTRPVGPGALTRLREWKRVPW